MLRTRLRSSARIIGVAHSKPQPLAQPLLMQTYLRQLDRICPGHGQTDFVKQVFPKGPKGRGMLLDPRDDLTTASVEDIYTRSGHGLVEHMVRTGQRAMDSVGVQPKEVTGAVFVSEVPNCAPLNTRVWTGLGLNRDIRSRSVIGTGCAGGVKGLISAVEVANGPAAGGLVLAAYGETLASRAPHLEPLGHLPGDLPGLLARLKKNPDDKDAQYWFRSGTVIQSILGDAFAGVIVAGDQHPHFYGKPWSAGPVVIDTAETIIHDSADVAWVKPNHTGVRMHLSPRVPIVVPPVAAELVTELLARNNLSPADVSVWLPHNGGVKVLTELERLHGFKHKKQLWASWKAFEESGNTLSVGIMEALGFVMESNNVRPGDLGVMVSFGPGMEIAAALVQWPTVTCRSRCSIDEVALSLAH